jgi:hypothetical protein
VAYACVEIFQPANEVQIYPPEPTSLRITLAQLSNVEETDIMDSVFYLSAEFKKRQVFVDPVSLSGKEVKRNRPAVWIPTKAKLERRIIEVRFNEP